MQRGNVWLVSLDLAAGKDGREPGPWRSSSRGPSTSRRRPVVLPITTGRSLVRRRGFAVSLAGADTHTVGVIRCDQLRALDLWRPGTGDASKPDHERVLARLAAILA